MSPGKPIQTQGFARVYVPWGSGSYQLILDAAIKLMSAPYDSNHFPLEYLRRDVEFAIIGLHRLQKVEIR